MTRRSSALLSIVAAAAVAFSAAGPAAADPKGPDSPGQQSSTAREKARVNTAEEPPVIGTCRLVAPDRISVYSETRDIPVSLTGGCTLRQRPVAGWYTGPYDEPTDYVFFDESPQSSWTLWDDTPLGTTTWKGDFAYSDDFSYAYTQNTPTRTVKLASGTSQFTSSRSGNNVTLNIKAHRYSTAWHANIPWGGIRGTIQHRTPGTTAWTNTKWIYLNSAGAGTSTFYSNVPREFRIVFDEDSYVWGTTSGVVTR